jgi:hypothetical protein
MARKVFVRVLAEFSESGQLVPRSVTWEDGRQFAIDRILDVRQAVSLKVGGSGIRYTCRIRSRPVYLFLDNNQWFMEGQDSD